MKCHQIIIIELINKNLLNYCNDEKFDIITCFLPCMRIPEYNKIILKIKELLKPNGIKYIEYMMIYINMIKMVDQF